MVESLLLKIVTAILKGALFTTHIKGIVSALEIYTKIDSVIRAAGSIKTANDCRALGLLGVQVASDFLVDSSIDKLLSVGSDTFVVKKKKSGLYVASHYAPRFKVENSSNIVSMFNDLRPFRSVSGNNQGTFKRIDGDIFTNDMKDKFTKL